LFNVEVDVAEVPPVLDAKVVAPAVDGHAAEVPPVLDAKVAAPAVDGHAAEVPPVLDAKVAAPAVDGPVAEVPPVLDALVRLEAPPIVPSGAVDWSPPRSDALAPAVELPPEPRAAPVFVWFPLQAKTNRLSVPKSEALRLNMDPPRQHRQNRAKPR
jgi:hypothetical protein